MSTRLTDAGNELCPPSPDDASWTTIPITNTRRRNFIVGVQVRNRSHGFVGPAPRNGGLPSGVQSAGRYASLPDSLPPCRRLRRRVGVHRSANVGNVPPGERGQRLCLALAALGQFGAIAGRAVAGA